MTINTSRREFEEHVKNEMGDIAVFEGGRYISPKIHSYWLVWQAARESLEADIYFKTI